MTNQQGAPEALRVEAAYGGDGKFIGYRLLSSGAPGGLLVWADQTVMSGFRIGDHFVPDYQEVIEYKPVSLVEAQQPAPSAAAKDAESRYGFWVIHPEHDPDGFHNGGALSEREKADGWTEVALTAATKCSPTPQADSVLEDAEADTVVLEAALRAIHQAIDLIGEPDTERLRTVRRVLRGAVVVAEDSKAPQADSQPAPVGVLHKSYAMTDGSKTAYWFEPTEAGQNLPHLSELYARAPADSVTAPAAFQRALDIRTAQGWKLGGDKVPVLYTDTINGKQVCRDDIWLCTTAAFATPPAQAADYDHGPQSATVQEAARHVGKWLNERPNRPLDLRDVAMLCNHAQAADSVLEDAARWQEHVGKLDALVAYCPTCCQGFIAQKEMTRDQIIFECGKTAGRAARAPADSVTAPAGWQAVPVTPTSDQLNAACEPFLNWQANSKNTGGPIQSLGAAIYRAMLSAAPTPPAQAADSVLEDAPPSKCSINRYCHANMCLETDTNHEPDCPQGHAARKQGANHD